MELLPTTPQNLQESTLYLAGAGFCVFILVILYNGLKHPLANVPGPWHTRWTDWVYTYHNLRGAAPLYIHALHQKYGPVVRVSTNFVNVADLKGAQRIHRIRGEFLKSPWYQNIAGPDRLNVFNTQDIDEHRRLRRLLSGPMSESNLKTLIPQVENKVRLAIDRMVEETKSRGVADVAKWWMFMATDVIGELTFGESFRMLEYGKVCKSSLPDWSIELVLFSNSQKEKSVYS
jgi:cytochrome P450